MAILVYLWLYDEEDKLVRGAVEVNGREDSIEIVGMQHDVFIPTDDSTAATTAICQHESYTFEKETDRSSPLLYRALTMGRSLKKAIFRYYHINYNGLEEEYFNAVLKNAKICHVVPIMLISKIQTSKSTDIFRTLACAKKKSP